jgi:pilus assembly protein CpaE
LEKAAAPIPPEHVVPYGLAAEQASRMAPRLVYILSSACAADVLQCARELRAVTTARLFVIGPSGNAQHILEALRAGADEYLDIMSLDQEVAGALSRFRQKVAAAQAAAGPGKVMAVIGASGGAGSSFLAVNLATALAQAHGNCGLIDLRLAAGDLTPLLNLHPHYTLADLCENLHRVDADIFETLVAFHESGVGLIAAPADTSRLAVVSDRGVRQAVALARTRFAYVIVDLENSRADLFGQVAVLCDRMIVVTRLDYTSVRNTRNLLSHLTELSIEPQRIVLVANRYRQSRELPVKSVQEAIGRPIDAFIYDDPSRVNRSVNSGSPLLAEFPRSKVAKQLRTLAQALNGQAK